MNPTTIERPLAVSVIEAARLLGIGRSAAYQAVAAGDIPSVRIGGRIIVPTEWLLEKVNGRAVTEP